jgi:hypothetical protein
MAFDRESIWSAAFNALSVSTGAVTKSRKLVPFDQVPAEQQPAIFLAQGKESHRPVAGRPAILTLYGELFLYTNTGSNTEIIASTQLNQMLDAIDDAMAFDDVARGRCTLGGLVQHAWIEGDTIIAEGQQGQQAVAIVPIALLVNQ